MRTQFESSIKIYSDIKQFDTHYKWGKVHVFLSVQKELWRGIFVKTSDLVTAGIPYLYAFRMFCCFCFYQLRVYL